MRQSVVRPASVTGKPGGKGRGSSSNCLECCHTSILQAPETVARKKKVPPFTWFQERKVSRSPNTSGVMGCPVAWSTIEKLVACAPRTKSRNDQSSSTRTGSVWISVGVTENPPKTLASFGHPTPRRTGSSCPLAVGARFHRMAAVPTETAIAKAARNVQDDFLMFMPPFCLSLMRLSSGKGVH